MLREYEKNSERFRESVESANNEKKRLREEINSLEVEVRRLRDKMADKQTENKNLEYLLHNEQMLAEEKAKLEEKALILLSNDLEE